MQDKCVSATVLPTKEMKIEGNRMPYKWGFLSPIIHLYHALFTHRGKG